MIMACRNGRIDPLTAMHHAGLYQQHLCELMEIVAGPVLSSVKAKSVEVLLQLGQLQWQKHALLHNSQPQHNDTGLSPQVTPSCSASVFILIAIKDMQQVNK